MCTSAANVAAVSMQAYEKMISVDTNNLANSKTRGFKESHLMMKDIGWHNEKGSNSFNDSMTSRVIQYGMGTVGASSIMLMKQGQLENSSSPYDLAINGHGYFQIQMDDGSIAYTKDGTFDLDSDRRLCTTEGKPLIPEIIIPQEANQFIVKSNGEVFVTIDGQTAPQNLGQIQIAVFQSPNGLKQIGDNLLIATSASGDAVLGYPEDAGFGKLRQYFYESSNADPLRNLMHINECSKTYTHLTKVIQHCNQMAQAVNDRV